MKKFAKAAVAIILMMSFFPIVGCAPEENNDSDVRVTTYTPQDITQTTAVCGGDVIVTQGLSLNELGVCWSKERNPSVEDTLVSTANWRDTFVRTITGLDPSTTYYVRAFALRGLYYYYGEEKSFTTLGGELPLVTTMEVSDITTNSATFGGEVVSDGGLAVSERGVCWGVNPYPTIEDEHSGVGSGLGLFSMNVHGLEQNTTFYVRAYAKNYYGVSYGSQVSFMTQKEELPTVTTFDITNITTHSAISGGEVISEGGVTVIERGICWSINSYPTTDDAHNSSGSGLGSFTVSMFGLEQNTTYHIRAYATNSVGTGYGEDKEFITNSSGGFGSHEYVDLGLPSGTLWATCNVGAESSEEYGEYFAWGEIQPKNNYDWNTYQYCNGTYRSLTKYCNDSYYGNNGFTDNLTVLLPVDDAATEYWGDGWRIPTYDDWVELCQFTTDTWVTQNGVTGRVFTAMNGNSIFLPATGFANGNEIQNTGWSGSYRSSSLGSRRPDGAWCFGFDTDEHEMHDYGARRDGVTIRPVRSYR